MENTHKNNTRDDFQYNSKNQPQSSNLSENPFGKLRPIGTLFKPIQPNTRHSGRGTVCVPLTNFKGVSENAGFLSKLNFFNEGAKKDQKPLQKQVTVDLKKDKFESKKKINEVEKEDKAKKLKDTHPKRFSMGEDDSNAYNSLQKFQNCFDKNEKDKKSSNKKKEINNNTNNSNNKINNTKLNSNDKFDSDEKSNKIFSEAKGKNTDKLDIHWTYENILLNYNILDFTSK